LAVYFLWVHRKFYPEHVTGSPALGCLIFVASLAARYVSVHYYLPFVDGWSILIWLASVVTTLGGLRLLAWAGPSIGFLAFMIPLPFGVEGALSQPLQRVATKISCYTLQLLGQPAFAEGNVILVGDLQLEVAQACSGLRLFLSILALSYAYIVLIRRTWWEKLIVALSTVPIALLCNAARIVATGFLLQATSSEWHPVAHDMAGWGMIPLAALSFWLVQWYVGLLFRADEPLDFTILVRRASL
jgi:exosortase